MNQDHDGDRCVGRLHHQVSYYLAAKATAASALTRIRRSSQAGIASRTRQQNKAKFFILRAADAHILLERPLTIFRASSDIISPEKPLRMTRCDDMVKEKR